MDVEIQGFPAYRMNKAGEIFSRYKFKTGILSDEWRPVRHVLDKGVGYFLVTLVHDRVRKNQFVHRLLATHFIPNPLGKPFVNHIDGNKQNNTLDNLEWVTHAENCAHASRTGLLDQRTKDQSVGVIQLDKSTGFLIAEHQSLHSAGRDTGVAWQNIWKVCDGRRATAGGFGWAYK